MGMFLWSDLFSALKKKFCYGCTLWLFSYTQQPTSAWHMHPCKQTLSINHSIKAKETQKTNNATAADA
jgi:hypothetical protein